jgi:hypothetical protein
MVSAGINAKLSKATVATYTTIHMAGLLHLQCISTHEIDARQLGVTWALQSASMENL